MDLKILNVVRAGNSLVRFAVDDNAAPAGQQILAECGVYAPASSSIPQIDLIVVGFDSGHAIMYNPTERTFWWENHEWFEPLRAISPNAAKRAIRVAEVFAKGHPTMGALADALTL